MTARFCICIPARNEAARLPVLFDALAAQSVAGTIPIALCINNSHDDSRAVAERAARNWHGRLALAILDRDLPPAEAHAGTARRIAMDLGLSLVDAQVVGPVDHDGPHAASSSRTRSRPRVSGAR